MSDDRSLPPATFDFLTFSLIAQAEINLGYRPDPMQGQTHIDLALARHSIDLLAMLQQKTKGNLTLDEQRLLDNAVTELRFRFVQASQAVATPEAPTDGSTA